MQVNNQQAAQLLQQTTGIDATRQARTADRMMGFDQSTDARVTVAEQNRAEQTTTTNPYQNIDFGGPRMDRVIDLGLPFDLDDLFVPGREVNTGETTNAGDADGTVPTETSDSLLAGVDLFDFDSLDAAIAKGQEMIANGEGSAQLFGELQLLLQSQMQMVSLISNMQKVQHDTAMAAINNIR